MDGSENKNQINNNIFSREFNFNAGNPFNNELSQKSEKITKESSFDSSSRRLNGYDSTILNKTQFDQNDGEELSIDYRIKEKESTIKDLDAKIKIADTYGTQNESLSLKAKRQRVIQELDTLRKQQLYGGRVLGEKFSHEGFKQKMSFIYQVQHFISRQILARLSKKIKSIVTITDSLEQLSQISKSVDELIEMNVPYGEKTKNYEKLTSYLSQANQIHSKISKSLGK